MVSSGIIFFDDEDRYTLLPLSYLRPLAEIRIGIWTIHEKWCHYLNTQSFSFQTSEYLQAGYPIDRLDSTLYIKGNILPDAGLVTAIQNLKNGQALYQNTILIAATTNQVIEGNNFSSLDRLEFNFPIRVIQYPEQIFTWNKDELLSDFNAITAGRESAIVEKSNQIKSPENIFVEEGAIIEHSILNAVDGPIYIGKNAKILDGCMLRNGVAICENAVLKMGAKIYGATTIGPGSKVGGEIKNAVIFGNTNKSHDGYLGNAVIAEWCNLGADTNASNLKNDYSEVKLWDYSTETLRKTGTQFCGLIMGDHSKCGINTMFNTGTIVGVNCNIFGAGFQKNFIPSFSWGGPRNYKSYKLEKAKHVAALVWNRRHKEFTSADEQAFEYIYSISAKYRK